MHTKKTGYLSSRCAEKGHDEHYNMIVYANKAAICTILHLNKAKNPGINIDLDKNGGFICKCLARDRCNFITLDLHHLFVREAIEFVDSILYAVREGAIFSSDFAGKSKSVVITKGLTIDLIVGLGSHSFNSESKLKPAILKHLRLQNINATIKGDAMISFSAF